jgi:cytochrome c-type biogenesis protein CcmH
MVLHLIFAAMLVAAILAILVPLSRSAKLKASRGASELDLHRLRLAEIDRDLDRGLLDAASAEKARNEAARMFLRATETAASQELAPAAGEGPSGGRTRRRVVALVGLVGLPAMVLPVYAWLGSPGLPSRPFRAEAPADGAKLDLATIVGQIEAHLATHPDDGKGYEVVAPVYVRMGRFEDAVRARSEALRLLGETPDRLANLAQARILAAGGVVTKDAADAIARALALDPKHVEARFLQAIAFEQDGKNDEAASAYRAMLAEAPPNARWRPAVEARLARLVAPAGAEAQAIASMPQGAQSAAIRSMVEGLAARLKQQGGPIEDWAKLVRSYAVLGEADKARAALADARAAYPDEASSAALSQVARASGLEGASSEAQTIASMPQGAQSAAIRSMVEGLAARLKQQGGPVEDWAKLVRSYAVLGEADKARAALADARAAYPDETSRAALAQVARASGLEGSP